MTCGFGKSPYAALRFTLRRCGVRNSTPHSSVSRALPLGFFAKPLLAVDFTAVQGI